MVAVAPFDASKLNLKLYIGGKHVEAPLTLPVVNPATEEVFVHAPSGAWRACMRASVRPSIDQ
jgi:hypothetical protein